MKLHTIIASVLGVLALGVLWLKFVHDPQVRRTAALDARDVVVDSVVGEWRDSVEVVFDRDSARADSIVALAAAAALLRTQQSGLRTVTDTLIRTLADTAMERALLAAVAAERAKGDSARTADSTQIASLEAAVAARTRLLRAARDAVGSLRVSRDAWRAEARRSRPFTVGCTVGPVVSTAGFAPVGLACGVGVKIGGG